MGIPKFYRWLSERYPCLSEVLKEYQIPEFDNLYLDMNGIIHTCSHPDDSSIYIEVPESKIFGDICHYIEVLFRMIKPQKVFYMAVDGVAPRAKMNQQRSRRFRSAKEAELILKKEMRKGGEPPTGTRFDSNCITPGTEFMTRLNEALKQFVASKVKSDPMWQRPLIIFSGHEAPGEGEHKIMDFIRREKSRSGFDPNTRHCLYGLDADLIMLSLVTHEPHFSLLREEIKFTKKENQKRSILPEDTTFHLLHISILRDYLNLEFASLQNGLPFDYDLERIIDDWVLMGFLVGNDFVPNLPNLHIHHDCLPVLWKAYKESLPTLGGYLNEGGMLNLGRFEQYLTKLHQFDYEKFEENYSDMKWLKGKKKGRKMRRDIREETQENNHNLVGTTCSKKIEEEDDYDDDDEDDGEDDFDAIARRNDVKYSLTSEVVGIPSATEFLENSDHTIEAGQEMVPEKEPMKLAIRCDERMCEEFRKYKTEYYKEKLEIDDVDEELLQSFANEYVEAIQWILHYYYNGIQSWSWFYPHHYAPFLSDVRNFSHLKLTFNMGRPFLPFQQLMAVLPKASSQLLPSAFQKLMEPGSSVEEYYPEDFKTDLNGKVQEWEAVVLIPFIDEKVLLSAMEPLSSKLSSEEKSRNKHGPHNVYCFQDKRDLESYRSKGGRFKEEGKILKWDLPADYFVLKVKDLYKGLCKEVNLRSLFYGFPTLRHVPHRGSLQKQGVKVFNRSSANLSMILKLTPREESLSIEQIGKDSIGRVVLVNWPHLCEVLVVQISSDEVRFSPKFDIQHEVDSLDLYEKEVGVEEQAEWHREAEYLRDKYLNRFGIDVGETQLLLGAKRLIGKKFVVKRSGEVVLEKYWSSTTEQFLYQTSVKYSKGRNPDQEEHYQLTDYFCKGENVFLLANPHYGSEGKILEVMNLEHPRILVQFVVPQEPNLDRLKAKADEFEKTFVASYLAAQRLGISSHLLSRITGTIYLKKDVNDSSKLNIGLNLKMTKQNMEMPGYTKRVGKDWLYSQKVIELVREYMEKFPDLFEGIASVVNNDNFFVSDIFEENGMKRFSELESFLKEKVKGFELKPLGTQLLEGELIKEIEDEVTSQNSKSALIKMKVKPHLLYVPKIVHSPCVLDEWTSYELFDRVVNIRPGFTVPLGLRGTLVGVEPGEKGQDYLYHVLYDKEFEGAMPLRCSNNKCYRVPATSLVNISHGVRLARKGSSRKTNDNLNHSSFQSHVNGFIKGDRRICEPSPRIGGSKLQNGGSQPTVCTSIAQEKCEAPQPRIMTNPERNCSDNAYAQAWDRLKQDLNVKQEEPKTNNLPMGKATVRPVPPNLKPPQAWIEKSSKNQNGPQNVAQMGKKISIEDLLRTAESSVQRMSINGLIQPLPHQQQQQQQMNPVPQHNYNHHHHHHHHQQQQHQSQQQHLQHHNHGQQQQQHFNQLQQQKQQKWLHMPSNNQQQSNLIFFCQTNRLSIPKYEMRSIDGGFQGRVHIQGKGWFSGPISGNEFTAIEEVSGFALHNLQNHPQFSGSSMNLSHYNQTHDMGNLLNKSQPKQQPPAACPTSLNPKANTFIPTQVLLRQKSISKPISSASDGQDQKPSLDTHPIATNPPKYEGGSQQPESKETLSKTNSRKVTKHKNQHKKRIAASFADPRAI